MKTRITIILIAFLAAAAGCASHSPSLRRDSSVAFFRAKLAASPATTREVVLHALSHVGTRYQSGGSHPDIGFDCSGLVHYVVRQAAGVGLPREARAMSEIGTDVSAEELQPGDLVFFNTLGRPYSHVGIYLGDQRFIHAPTQGGTVGVVDMRLPYWQQRFDGARRLEL